MTKDKTTETTEFSLYRSNWPTDDAELLAMTITESIHDGLDGWTKQEQEVIERYLADIALACAESKK